MSPSTSLLLLLLLGLSQALPLQEEGDNEEKDPDTIDMTTRILTANNGSNEILLEGDLLAPRTRNAIKCYTQNCFWKKNSSGKVMVPYVVSSEYTSSEKQLISNALEGFHGKTCIRFVPRTNEYDYITVQNQGGCFSSLGRVGGVQVLSLSRPGCLYYGIVQHEFSHALGFQHEQCRSDRDSYIRIVWENINPSQAYNFNKQDTNNLNTPYDYGSIMHYDKTAFSINGRATMVPVPNANVQIGQRQGLSSWDITRINKLYGC
ncbi:high choriolytic enzyme 1-like isoform X1 [Etheostoma cragini]|uniref:high choriolytic enzyme 1-like isoform X1 n=1 Tax=Etheostoma cragini TaxID=417921 RepID=UPI00155E1BD9|nr:high choriolytic enzyme 1-like isoform X1 [Etheostoma cragini]